MTQNTKNKFQDQKDDEEIIFSIKKHPWYFFWFIIYTILALVLVFLSFKYLGASIYTSIVIFGSIIVLGYMFIVKYFRWSRTQYILTNHRVISFDQEGFWKKVMKEARLENILFISNKVEGPISSLLELGNVHIRASGVTEDEIVFEGVANPYEVQKEIAEAQKKYVGISSQQESEEEIDEHLRDGNKKSFDIFKKKKDQE